MSRVHDAAPLGAGAAVGLDDLVGGWARFRAESWARRPSVHRSGLDFSPLLDEEEILADLRHGLLTPPYFTVVRDGVARYLTEQRTVNGRPAHGYAAAAAIEAAIAEGATYKFNHLEHWKPALAAVARDLAEACGVAEVEAAAFLSPAGHAALPAHTDGMHVLVLQVSGTKSWKVGYLEPSSVATAGLHGDGELSPDESFAVTLEPGDVLYVPHGSPHQALAETSRSLHVTLLVELRTPHQVMEDLLAELGSGAAGRELRATWSQRPDLANVEAVRGWLVDGLEAIAEV